MSCREQEENSQVSETSQTTENVKSSFLHKILLAFLINCELAKKLLMADFHKFEMTLVNHWHLHVKKSTLLQEKRILDFKIILKYTVEINESCKTAKKFLLYMYFFSSSTVSAC